MKIKRGKIFRLWAKRVFFDYASTTPTHKKVLRVMKPFWNFNFANPLSLHSEGLFVKEAVNNSRQKIAKILGVKKEEIVFTSGATESNNLAILGVLKTYPKNQKKKIIVSPLEHVSVLNVLENYAKEFENNTEIIYLKVDSLGRINLNDLENKLDKDVVLISVMFANNEIGNVNNLREISSSVKKFKNKIGRQHDETPFIHSDLGQAPVYFDIHLDRLGIHLASIDGSKIYGPKGAGLLIKKFYVPMQKILEGGGQEFDLRPGTQNVPAVVGLAEALEINNKNFSKNFDKTFNIQKYFIEQLKKQKIISDEGLDQKIKIMGDLKNRLPNNLNLCFQGLNSEFATICLDELGVACSPATSCKNVSEMTRSAVVDILDSNCGVSSLRFTWDMNTTKGDIDFLIKNLIKVLKQNKIV